MTAFAWLDVALVYYFLALHGVYILLSFVSFRAIYVHLARSVSQDYEELARSPLTPPISIVVPAYNEEVGIATTVNNVLHLDYMRYEVVVVNDGSTDGTLDVLKRQFGLVPVALEPVARLPTKPVRGVYRSELHHNLVVVDKENGGCKADANNAGLNYASHPYFCATDADVILEPSALRRMIQPVVEGHDRVVAVGGIVRVSNGCAVEKGRIVEVDLPFNPIVLFQILEYYRSFLAGRTGWSELNALLIVSGAFGLFERDLVVRLGGYRASAIGEDMDLVMRLRELMGDAGEPFSVRYVPDPICWTEAPSSLKVLARQRRRWQRGLLDSLSFSRGLALRWRHGAAGLIAYPYFWLFEGWGVLIELFGYLLLLWQWTNGTLQTDFAIAFFFASLACGTILSLSGLLLGQMAPMRYPRLDHWIVLTAFAILENFGYRQVIAVMRLLGTFDYVFGGGVWGRMERVGHRLRTKSHERR